MRCGRLAAVLPEEVVVVVGVGRGIVAARVCGVLEAAAFFACALVIVVVVTFGARAGVVVVVLEEVLRVVEGVVVVVCCERAGVGCREGVALPGPVVELASRGDLRAGRGVSLARVTGLRAVVGRDEEEEEDEEAEEEVEEAAEEEWSLSGVKAADL